MLGEEDKYDSSEALDAPMRLCWMSTLSLRAKLYFESLVRVHGYMRYSRAWLAGYWVMA